MMGVYYGADLAANSYTSILKELRYKILPRAKVRPSISHSVTSVNPQDLGPLLRCYLFMQNHTLRVWQGLWSQGVQSR